MAIRQIEDHDIGQVHSLLCEGFPRQSAAYWQRALARLQARPAIADLPRLGVVLEVNGQLEGVLLTIVSRRNGRIFCNLSSWYVREGHRQHSIFLLRKAMQNKTVTYTDISPAPAIVGMIGKLGFVPHTGGAVLLSALQMVVPGRGKVRPLRQDHLDRLEADTRALVARHLEHGCSGLWIEGVGQAAEVALYRIKRLKKVVPCARFVSGAPEPLIAAAGPLMRALAMQGIGFALIDVPEHFQPAHGKLFPGRDLRYVSGGAPPPPGDLLDTELAIFGP